VFRSRYVVPALVALLLGLIGLGALVAVAAAVRLAPYSVASAAEVVLIAWLYWLEFFPESVARFRAEALRLCLDLILTNFDLAHDLGSDYFRRDLLIRLFDQTYYGPVTMADVVDAALQNMPENGRPAGNVRRKTFDDYYRPPHR